MMMYLWIKLLHILSATILFGTGIGTAFFMSRAYQSDSIETFRVTTKNAVLADWLFTTPAVIVQLITGLWLTLALGIPFSSLWFVMVLALYVFVGACWLPVVWIQIRIRNKLATGAGPADVRHLMRIWITLGVLAFGSILVIFYLMVTKYGTGRLLFN